MQRVTPALGGGVSGAGALFTTAPAPKKEWRIIPAIDRDPRIVAYVQGVPGRVGLIAAMAVLAVALSFFDINLLVAPLATVCAYARSYRRYLIPLATLLLLYVNGFWVDIALVRQVIAQDGLAGRLDASWLAWGSLIAVLVMCCGLMTSWPRLAALPVFRRPTLCLISVFVALVIVAQSPIAAGVPRAVLWALVMAFQPYLWFLAYALSDQGMLQRRPIWQHLGVFHPFWGSTMTPFGKGLAYLERYDARTSEDLAVTQLKGLKLACWTLILAACLWAFVHVVHGLLGLPHFDRIFLDFVGGVRDPRYLGWASLVAFFVEDVLCMTLFGGAIVACARMAGFRLLRNTYRPLEARTLADFWNRYYFYYKELLVDHFFYPVFIRCFRTNRRLRIFFATFMAACVGNLLFHFIRDIHFVAELGWRKALSGEASHAFYTFLLAIGVGVSQMRGRARNAGGGWARTRLLPLLWVSCFFCVLHVFDAPLDRIHSIGQRAQFLSYLMGVDTWI
jgi:hypothetical protein